MSKKWPLSVRRKSKMKPKLGQMTKGCVIATTKKYVTAQHGIMTLYFVLNCGLVFTATITGRLSTIVKGNGAELITRM